MSSHWPVITLLAFSAVISRHCSSAHSKFRHKLRNRLPLCIAALELWCANGRRSPQPAFVCGEHRLHAPLMQTLAGHIDHRSRKAHRSTLRGRHLVSRRLHRRAATWVIRRTNRAGTGHAVVRVDRHIQINSPLFAQGRQNPILGSQTGCLDYCCSQRSRGLQRIHKPPTPVGRPTVITCLAEPTLSRLAIADRIPCEGFCSLRRPLPSRCRRPRSAL